MPVRSTLLLLALLAACAPVEPAPTEGACSSDADCADGSRCRNGACVVAGGGEGGAGGGGGSGNGVTRECERSEDCLPAPFSNIPAVTWDGEAGVSPVCTSPPVRCADGQVCEPPTVCRSFEDVSLRPGGASCSADAQCASDRCIDHEGRGVCLKLCVSREDCVEQERCPEHQWQSCLPPAGEGLFGLTCEDLVLENVHLRRCVPNDTLGPEATLCRLDADCERGACRFTTDSLSFADGPPLCTDRPADARPTGARCEGFRPTECAGGACNPACESEVSGELGHFCDTGPVRCTAPCLRDADCPSRFVCLTGEPYSRVGDWMLPFQEGTRAGREQRLCQIVRPGCFDDVDCCPIPAADGTCGGGWSGEPQRCSVRIVPPSSAPRLLTTCEPIVGLAPGACCDGHEACDGKVCVPARPGTPCEGGGVCSTPCDPDPDPNGIPGDFDDRDRCAQIRSDDPYHQGSRCSPFRYEHTTLDGLVIDATLNVCQ